MPWSGSIGLADYEPGAATAIYLSIADEIERCVRSGMLIHADRLPSTDIIAKQFNVTVPTAQHALSVLMKRGLLKRRPRHGTTVDCSGSSRCVCVVCGSNPFSAETEYDRLFLKGLDVSFRRRGIAMDCRISLGGSDFNSNIARLAEDAESGRFACILPVHATLEIMNWLMARRNLRWTWAAHIDYRVSAFRAIDHLLSKGYRKISSVSMFPPVYYPEPSINHELEGVWAAYGHHGLPAPASPILYWGSCEADGYENIKKLMADPESRPDALFINHDILARGVLRGLAELGIVPGKDIGFVSHANKGDSFAWPSSVARIEVDPEEMAEATAEHIERNLLRPGEAVSSEAPRVAAKLIAERQV